ncbi:MAG: potassium-transporting ATPase subunit KdpA [Selenomonas sp.]|nr:potassium-transporting ATPase subunit KdpA [Selenomonas sp.]
MWPDMSLPLAFNTAASFVTNTNWQSYQGEAQLSYLTQMLGMTTQNFVSAGSGIAVLFALLRGFRSYEGGDNRKFLGRSDPQHCLYPAATGRGSDDGAGLAGRGAEFLGV